MYQYSEQIRVDDGLPPSRLSSLTSTKSIQTPGSIKPSDVTAYPHSEGSETKSLAVECPTHNQDSTRKTQLDRHWSFLVLMRLRFEESKVMGMDFAILQSRSTACQIPGFVAIQGVSSLC